MNAVIVSVTIKDGEAATNHLRSNIVPQVKQAPGFVAGYWVRLGEDQGRSTIVFESEEAAQAVAERIRQDPPPAEAVSLDNVEIGEVVESA